MRAMMVVRANAMTYNAPSPQLVADADRSLNTRITPVVQSRGTLGEGDLAQLSNVGRRHGRSGRCLLPGHAHDRRRGAGKRAGLKPIQPFAADDNALTSSNAYATGIAALAVNDARASTGMGRPHLCDGSERHEFQHHAPQHSGAAGAAVQVAELGRGPCARHDQGQLPVRRRSASNHPGPGKPARVLHPPGLGLGGLGRAARRGGVADELLGSQSRRAHRSVSPQDSRELATPPDDEVLREGGPEQQRQARLHRVECELGPLSDGEQAGGLRHRAGEHGHRGVAAHRSVLQSILHGSRIRRRCCTFRRATVSQSIWPAAAATRRWICCRRSRA